MSVHLAGKYSSSAQLASLSTAKMATPAVASIHDISLPKFCKTGAAVSVKDISSPASIASKWLSAFETTLSSGKIDELTSLIHEDGWWRDQLAVDWEFHTKRGIKNIVDWSKLVFATSKHTSLGSLLRRKRRLLKTWSG
jgi:hypothetical protein